MIRSDRRLVATAFAASALVHLAVLGLIPRPALPPMPDGTRFTVLLIPVPGEPRAESARTVPPSLAVPPAPEGKRPSVRPRKAEQAGVAAPAAGRRRPWVSAGPGDAPVAPFESRLADAAAYLPPEKLSVHPQFLPFEMPYPRRAFEEGRRAVVVVQVMLDEQGRVVEAIAAPDAPADFAAAAVEGLRAARFIPAQAGGRPVKARAYFAVSFVIE